MSRKRGRRRVGPLTAVPERGSHQTSHGPPREGSIGGTVGGRPEAPGSKVPPRATPTRGLGRESPGDSIPGRLPLLRRQGVGPSGGPSREYLAPSRSSTWRHGRAERISGNRPQSEHSRCEGDGQDQGDRLGRPGPGRDAERRDPEVRCSRGSTPRHREVIAFRGSKASGTMVGATFRGMRKPS